MLSRRDFRIAKSEDEISNYKSTELPAPLQYSIQQFAILSAPLPIHAVIGTHNACDAIVYQACNDMADPHYGELARMAEELAALRTADGKPYTLYALPWARAIVDDGRRLAASYANYLVLNGAVVMPSYGDPADEKAALVLAEAFPEREIVPVDCRPLIWQNGSLHCLTMQLPEGLLNMEAVA